MEDIVDYNFFQPGLGKLLNHPQHIKKMLNGNVVGPIHVDIFANNTCNFSCKYCCFGKYFEHGKRDGIELELNDFTHAIDVLSQYGLKAVTFSGGGNPIMWKYFDEGVDYVKEKGLKMSLITNGPMSLAKTETLAKFDWIRISIQSLNHAVKVCEFDLIPDNVRKSMSYIIFDQRTLNSIEKLGQWAKETNTVIRVAPMRPCSQEWMLKVKEQVDKAGKPLLFFDKPSGVPGGCYFAWIRGAIDWKGQYLPCPSIELSPESFGKIPEDFPVCHVRDLEEWLINNRARDMGYRCSHCNCGKPTNDYMDKIMKKELEINMEYHTEVDDVEFV